MIALIVLMSIIFWGVYILSYKKDPRTIRSNGEENNKVWENNDKNNVPYLNQYDVDRFKSNVEIMSGC